MLDLTRSEAGAFCTQLMADGGATVVKAEPAGGPASATDGALDRGKRRFEVELGLREGRRSFDGLVDSADVVVDNFAPGTLPRLGISYDELRRRRRSLITASITLWGVDSRDPLARCGGVAIVAEGESTLQHAAAAGDGSPLHFGFPLGDLTSGLAAYAAIVTSLLRRNQTGLGRHLAVSMVHSLITMNSTRIAAAQTATRPPRSGAAYGVFKSSDGFVVLGVRSVEQWGRLCELMGRSELVDASQADPAELNATVDGWTAGRATSELLGLLGAERRARRPGLHSCTRTRRRRPAPAGIPVDA